MDIAQLLLDLGGVLFALGVLGRVADRVGFSPIPFYLLVGLAFGRGGCIRWSPRRGFHPRRGRDRGCPAAARPRPHLGGQVFRQHGHPLAAA